MPKELFGNKVPFLGGLPIRFPVLENLAFIPLIGLTGPLLVVLGELNPGVETFELELDDDAGSLLVSILSGLPFKGMILAGESFRMGGIGPASSLSLALKS